MGVSVGRKMFLAGLLCLAQIAVVTFAPSQAHAADEFDSLRLKWDNMVTGGSSYSPSDVDIEVARIAITDRAISDYNAMLKTFSLSNTYLWSDLNSMGSDPADIRKSYERLRNLALAYRTHGSTLPGNATYPDFYSDLFKALDWLYAKYYNQTIPATSSDGGRTPYGNWWEWQIGTPLALNDIAVMLYSDLLAAGNMPGYLNGATSRLTNYMNAVGYFLTRPRNVGANRVWTSAITVVRGILVKNSATVSSGVTGLEPVYSYVSSGDGFYTDGSFIQHSKFAYTGSYGLSLLDNLSKILYLVDGSSWDVTDPDVVNVYRWVSDSVMPIMYKGALMDMTRGRDISFYARQDHVMGSQMIRSILKLAQTASATDALSFKRAAKYWISSDTFHDFYEAQPIDTIVYAKALVSDPAIVPATEPLRARVFASMDRAVQVRPGYAVGIGMFSNQIGNFESINGMNLKGWYTGAGATYLYNSDLGQFSNNYWPTVNPYRIPGTTALRNGGMANSSVSSKSWVGGTTIDDIYAAVGMDYEHVDSDTTRSLTAKKSWFMFDDEVIALGADITSSYTSTVETIVENRKLNSAGTNALTVDGVAKPGTIGWTETMSNVDWAHLAGSTSGSDIGYYFPSGTSLTGLRESRTGKWSSISTYSTTLEPGDPSHTNPYLNLYFDHGAAPAGGTYAYALLPGKTSAQVAAYAATPPFTVLANNANVQAVKENTLGLTGANFWTATPSTAGIITSSGKASVLVQENSNSLEVSVSDPTQAATGSVTITIDRAVSAEIARDPRVSVIQTSPAFQFTVDLGGSRGRPVKVEYSLQGQQREAENYTAMSGLTILTPTTDAAGGGSHLSNAQNGEWASYTNVDFGTGTSKLTLRLAAASTGGTIEARLGSATGPLAGSLAVPNTGGWTSWATVDMNLAGASGVQNLHLVFKRPDTAGVAIVNWFSWSYTYAMSGRIFREFYCPVLSV